MRILIFNWKDIRHPYAGGAEVNIHEQAKRWVKKGYEVIQFSPKFEGSKEEEIIDGIKIVRAGSRFSIYLLAPLYYLFKLRKECDVIVDIENGIPFFTPLFSRKPKLVIMHHVHQDVFFRELPFFIAWIPYLMEKYGLRLFYKNVKFVAVSETTRKAMQDQLKINNNIDIIYNGLDPGFFLDGIKKTSYPSILYLGRLMKYKRIDLLIDVFMEVLRQVPNAKLHIAGSGVVEDELKEKVKEIGLNGNVIFHGFIDEKEKNGLIKGSWIFVNPSSMEGWGVTVIEVNACGVPALAFNVPGLSEAIKNNETGFLVDNKDEMVGKIVLLLNDSKLRGKLGKNALKWSKNFSWDKTADKTLKLLQELK